MYMVINGQEYQKRSEGTEMRVAASGIIVLSGLIL